MKIRLSNTVFALPSLFILGATVSGSAGARDKNENTAFVLVVADGMSTNNTVSYDYTFRQVDVESGKFLKKSFKVSFNSLGSGEDEIEKPRSLETTLRFGGRAVPPGDYALVSRKARYRYGGSRRHDDSRCFALGTVVYRARANQTNLAHIGDALGRNNSINQLNLLSDASLVVAAKPKLTTPVVPAEVQGTIAFDGTKDGQYCMDPKTFTFTPMRR